MGAALEWPRLAQGWARLVAEAERAEVYRLQQSVGDAPGEGITSVLRVLRPQPPADIAAAIRAVLAGRGWEEWRIEDALCVNEHEDRTGRAVRHERDGSHSYGAYQLNANGKLPAFLRDYNDPLDVRQQASWLADELEDWQGDWRGFWFPGLRAREVCL